MTRHHRRFTRRSLMATDLCLLSSGAKRPGVSSRLARRLTIEDQIFDHLFSMSLDLNTILKDWPHENRAIKVRKILGLDGRQKFRPYVLMMNTRAKASIFLGQGKFAEAIGEIRRGRDAIAEFFQKSSFPELAGKSSEIHFLEEWLNEISAKRPRSKLEIMESEMETAVAKELYERAAELRDAIQQLKKIEQLKKVEQVNRVEQLNS